MMLTFYVLKAYCCQFKKATSALHSLAYAALNLLTIVILQC